MRTTLCLALALSALPSLAHAAEPTVQALDAWGRYTNVIELDYSSGDKRWSYVPRARFLFLVDGPASDDVALERFTIDGKPLGAEVKCPLGGDPMTIDGARAVVVAERKLDLAKLGVDRPATFAVTLGYRQLAAGVDHKDLATYRFAVKAHEGAGKVTEFHVDHDARLGEGWAHMKQDGTFELFTWFKSDASDKTRIDTGKLRCTVNGKALEIAEQVNERWSSEYEDYAQRDASGSASRARWSYNAFFAGNDPRGFFAANPGSYRCVYTRQGELDRVLTFDVADGQVVKPLCQRGASPLVRTPPSTTLVRVTLEAPQDAPFDAKAFGAGALLGREGLGKACGW